MNATCAGVILAGGLNSRMDGFNKAFLRIGHLRIIDRIIEILEHRFSEILLVTRTPEVYRDQSLTVIRDIFKVRSPLTGIHSGLVHMKADYAFCVGCDTPFLKKEFVEMMLDEIEPAADVVVPFSGTYFQPLCAVYSKRCIRFIEEQLARADPKVDNLFAQAFVKRVPYEKFQQIDPDLISFLNINTLEDLRHAERLAENHPIDR